MGVHTEAEFEEMAIDVLREHPLEWAARKIRLLPRFWFARPDGAGGPSGAVIAATSAAAAIALVVDSVLRARQIPLVACAVGLVASIGPLLLTQFEARRFLHRRYDIVDPAYLGDRPYCEEAKK